MSKDEILQDLNNSIAIKANDVKYINQLNRTEDKVKYLRIIKGYRQIEVAEMINRSIRQVQRIEKKLKNI